MIATLLILAAAVVAVPPLTKALGRNAGWPLAVAYLAAAGTMWLPASEVMHGHRPSWSVPWVPQLGINFALAADGLGVVFTAIALLIGAVVFIYSTRYLSPGRQLSFYQVMTIFTLSMTALVLADDLLLLFICWELTSLASFLLIARSGQPGQGASMRTLLLTFVGGLMLLSAVAVIWARLGTTSLSQILHDPVWMADPTFTTLVAVLVALAAFTKSAQFPFHVWLPDAMAAITPVSAYLHAAAVVKAGIFLLLRFSPIFHGNIAWNALLISAGLITTILGGWFALQQTDLKKLMAYSTVSQLGLIVATIGVGTEAALIAATFHTIAHALFKSGLFMMVGVIDHATHTRDLRRLPPKLYRSMPVSFAIVVLGAASMAGVPPMLGFISKEAILAAVQDAPGADWTGWVSLAIVAIGAVLTFSYCAKIVLGAFVDGPEDDRYVTPADPLSVAAAGLPIVVGLPLAFVVSVFDVPVGSAAQAALGVGGADPHLLLWHGLTLELAITVAVLALGVLVAFKRRRVFAFAERHRFPFTGAEVIAGIARLLGRSGRSLNRLVASDAPARHMAPIALGMGAIGIIGLEPLLQAGLPAQTPGLNRAIDLVLMFAITVAVVGVVIARARIAAVVSLSAVGILATVQILVLGAPDVALTQLLVESLSIIVIMLVLQKLPLTFSSSSARRKIVSLLIAGTCGGGVTALVWALNGRRERSPVADYYLTQTYDITGGKNIVNVILVEFRALDTLGELAVLGMAGVAIIAILSTVRHKHLDPSGVEDRIAPQPELALNPDQSSPAWRAIQLAWPNAVALQLMLRLINPVLIIISLMLFLRGHNEPGGGFIAALVASAVVGMVYLSTSLDRQIGPPKLPLALIGGGVITAVATGLVSSVVKGNFLQPLHGYIGDIHVSSSMIFDVGVYTAVVGLIMVAFNLLGTSDPTGEGTRERTDETIEGELAGPLDTVRGESARRVATSTTFLSDGQPPRELGR